MMVLMVACTPPQEAPAPMQATDMTSLEDSEWTVASLDGRPLLGSSNITAHFQGGTVGGYSGCNWYGSRYTVTDSTVKFEGAESTARACGVPTGVMEQEGRYFAALREVVAVRTIGERLALVDPAGKAVVTLLPRIKLAMNPADLVGTTWRLEAVNEAAVAGTHTLAFPTSGELSGFAGCRGYTGTWSARGDHISVTSMAMTAMECEQGTDALQREGQFTTDITEATYYRLAGDSLEIVTAPARRLTFVAARPQLEQVAGEWEKREETLPPIHLTLRVERDTLRARLRLSGSESTGMATFDGRHLRLALDGRPPMRAELVSATELLLRFTADGEVYRLRRAPR
jgi:heat shock protein HslJ